VQAGVTKMSEMDFGMTKMLSLRSNPMNKPVKTGQFGRKGIWHGSC
jgi:hypothetical protein